MKLGVLFRDGMVLQSGEPIRIFGEAEGSVMVSFDNEAKTVFAEDGKWLVEFNARAYGGPYTITVVSDGEAVQLNDVMVGEVILCAGQSNIQFAMGGEVTPSERYAEDPLLRVYTCESMEFHDILIPNGTLMPTDGWVKANPDTIDKWSAIGYLLGADLRRKKNCAVGILVCAQGASAIQSWIHEQYFAGEDAALQYHTSPPIPSYKMWEPAGTLYHVMLEPMIPYAVSSVVWYQGESNALPVEADNYLRMMELLVENWRTAFMNADLPFCVVQLADLHPVDYPEHWRTVQKQQAQAGKKIPNVVTVRCADICENDDMHPRTKYKLAKRISDALY